MAETAETNFDEFKRKDCVLFVADWLKGLHKLCSVFEGVSEISPRSSPEITCGWGHFRFYVLLFVGSLHLNVAWLIKTI